jgi:hypothetical protein
LSCPLPISTSLLNPPSLPLSLFLSRSPEHTHIHTERHHSSYVGPPISAGAIAQGQQPVGYLRQAQGSVSVYLSPHTHTHVRTSEETMRGVGRERERQRACVRFWGCWERDRERVRESEIEKEPVNESHVFFCWYTMWRWWDSEDERTREGHAFHRNILWRWMRGRHTHDNKERRISELLPLCCLLRGTYDRERCTERSQRVCTSALHSESLAQSVTSVFTTGNQDVESKEDA